MQRTPASRKGSQKIAAIAASASILPRSWHWARAAPPTVAAVRPFKGIIWDHISEFEYSHAVGLSASPLVSVGGAFRLASPLSRIDSQRRKARRLASRTDREIRARRQLQAAKAIGLDIRKTIPLSQTEWLQ